MRKPVLAASLLSVLTLLIATDGPRAAAQWDRNATELTASVGVWTAFMPKYKGGSIVQNGGGSVVAPNVFSADQIGVGPQGRLRGLYHVEGYRTMFEASASITGFDNVGSRRTISDPNASETVWLASLDGTSFLSTPDGGSATFDVNGDLLHHDEYVGLRDRFDLTNWCIGVLDIGCGFHHMRFDQNFALNTNFSTGDFGSYDEDLETNYYGGQVVATVHRRAFGHHFMLDTAIGLYDMDGRYRGTSEFRNGGGSLLNSDYVVQTGTKTAFSTDIGLRFDMVIHGVLTRAFTGFRYISDMSSIDHPQTNILSIPASLNTDSAYFINAGLEIKL